MIQKVEIKVIVAYKIVCDRCAKVHFNKSLKGEEGWVTESLSIEDAFYHGWEEIDGKLYCPDCVEYDEETKSYKPKKERQ